MIRNTPTATGPATATTSAHGAQVLPVPPPLFYGLAFAVGMVLHAMIVPLPMGGGLARVVPGLILVGAGFALAGSAVARVRRRHTTIVPHRPVAALLTDGPYRLSRNPMYTGLALTYLGCTVLADTWWPLLTLPVALLGIQALVIGPEEPYLATRFGHGYTDYTQHTRRWL